MAGRLPAQAIDPVAAIHVTALEPRRRHGQVALYPTLLGGADGHIVLAAAAATIATTRTGKTNRICV